jgi:hypothetical protein
MFATGSHMAPNGVPFEPLFALQTELNIGLLPNKQLYIFGETMYWTQRAAPGITNPSQGKWDFSKREHDVNIGLAWNYYGSLEFRASAYALSNLNRGTTLWAPAGFKDGIQLESRYYFGSENVYDVGKLNFIGIGYRPSKGLVAGDGEEFAPGLFARAYVTYDLPPLWFASYIYGDFKVTAQKSAAVRLLEADVGIAMRPFAHLTNLEFRAGYNVIADVQAHTRRDLLYGAIRLGFGPATAGAL